MNLSKVKILESMLAITVGMLALYFIFNVQILLTIALVIGLIGMFSSTLSKYIARGWHKLAEGLGYINSRILLSLIFFIFLVPIAFLSRLVSGNPLQLKKQPKPDDSYFADRDHEYTAEDFEQVW